MTTPTHVIPTALVDYEIQYGLIVQVMPLTALGQQALRKQARETYPDPDPLPYEKPDPYPSLSGNVEIIPATSNPDYIRLINEVIFRRNFYYQCVLLNTCVNTPHRAELLQEYSGHLAAMEVTRIAIASAGLDEPLDAPIEFPWVRLLYFNLCTQEQVGEMLSIAQGKLPLAPGEVAAAIGSTFRKLVVRRG